jgi:hypothetical protein
VRCYLKDVLGWTLYQNGYDRLFYVCFVYEYTLSIIPQMYTDHMVFIRCWRFPAKISEHSDGRGRLQECFSLQNNLELFKLLFRDVQRK